MAISRFSQENTTNLSNFYQWLNDNKVGTFLENLTIENTTTRNTNDTIKITDTNATLTITAHSDTQEQSVINYTTTAISKNITIGTYYLCSAFVVKAILCSHGLFIQFYGRYQSNATNNWCAIAVTVDSNGELSCIFNDANLIPNADGMTVSNFDVYTPTSTNVAHASCRPFFGANLTCIAPVTAQGINELLSLPYAYVAIRTQLLAEGLQAVKINGDDYITNGVWYIKDGD